MATKTIDTSIVPTAARPKVRPEQAELEARWRSIEQAGGTASWIKQRLEAEGLFVVRENAASMSKAALARYKKSLKDEAAARRRLASEAWAAYRATHIVHLGEGVFWNDESDLDRFDLENAEARAAENELPRLDNPAQLAQALGIDIPTLRWLTFHRDAARSLHYSRFTIPKRDGTPRPIWAPSPLLKSIQRWILLQIVERLPVHGAAHAFLPGRSVATNAAVHTNSAIVLQLDLRDFFPSVTLPRVKGVFRKAGYREQIATLLALLCTESPREEVEYDSRRYFVALGPRCLPQGAPTSPGITNTLCLRLDRRLAGLAAKLGWRYTRYADDLTFSLPVGHKGDARLGPLLGGIKRITADEGFEIHPEKTRVSRPGRRQKVTGLVVNGKEGPRVPRTTRRMLRAAIHNLKQGKPLRDGESVETLVGYAAWIYMTRPEEGARYLADLSGLV